MVHGFDTDAPAPAVGALLVYAAWRSRDRKRFKITPEVWGQVERFVKSAAKRATTLAGFLERLLPRLSAATLNPRYCTSDWEELASPLLERLADGSIVERHRERVFLTRVLEEADAPAVLRALYRETVLVILLVRERLERERPHEDRIEAAAEIHLATAEELREAQAEDEAAGIYRSNKEAGP